MALIRFEPSYPRFSPDMHPTRNGFDPDGPWQMVPDQGTRYLHLNVVGVTDWSVEPVNPAIATVSLMSPSGTDGPTQENVYRVDGVHPGRTLLIARGPDREELGRIEIEVKGERRLYVAFYLISDKAGHKTTFTDKDTKAWTKFMNDQVFGPQINVQFHYLETVPITIFEDLKDRIDFAAIGLMPYVGHEGEAARIWHKITDFGLRDPGVFNVFCVWDFRNDSAKNEPHAAFVASKAHVTGDEMMKSGVNYNMCMLKEKVPDRNFFGYVLAHEAGHYLNRLPTHTERDDQLMTPGTAGTLLLKSDARRMNPTPG